MTSKRTTILFLSTTALIALLVGFSACGGSRAATPNKENAAGAQPAAIEVSVTQAISRDLSVFVEAQGSFAGDEQTDVAPTVAGKVVSVGVDLGTFVQKGHMLVQLDDRDARLKLEQSQAQLAQQEATVKQAEAKLGLKPGEAFDPSRVAEVRAAKASLDLANKQLARFDKLIESGDVSRSNYDEQKTQRDQLEQQYDAVIAQSRQSFAAVQTTRAGVEAARTQVDQAKKAINDALVVSPISGFVADRPADVGEYLSTSSKVATIVRTNPLRVRIDIPEQSIPDIKVGETVTATTSAFPDRTFNGHVARIAPNVTAASRTLTVEAEVENSSNELKPGQFATIRIMQPRTLPTVLVPIKAVQTDGNVSKVFVVNNGHAEQRLVQLGGNQGDLVEIKNGIASGETVATSNVDQLTDGITVRQ